jgi:hypothetical protein
MTDDPAFEELRSSLLRRRPRALGPEDGEEAFRQHQVLATAVHRAVKLIQEGSEGEGAAWIRYFAEFFPPGRNGREEAKTLWRDWRTGLVKSETPGPRVKMSHGQSQVHWVRDRDGALGVNLEDMWDDFVQSVDRLIDALRNDEKLRDTVLGRFAKQKITVKPFEPADSGLLPSRAASASAAAGATVFSWDDFQKL